MNQQDKLKFCKKCKLRSFSARAGVVCSLTDEKPAFKEICADYQYDHRIEVRRQELEEDQRIRDEINNKTGLEQFGIKNGIAAGIILMTGATIWFFVGASANIIFFYPPMMFFLGLIALVRGIKKRRSALKKQNNDLLDDEF